MSVGNTIGKLTNEPMLPKSTPAGSANPPEKKSWWSKWGDVVHTGLDILGAVPVIGIVADGANAAIYAAEGDYVNAAISGASAAANLIPGGGAAMKAGKAAVAVGKQAMKATAKEGAEALAKKALKEGAEKATKEGAEAAGKKAAKKAGSDAGGGVKGKGKKKTCKTGLCEGSPVNPVLGIKFLNGPEERDFDLPAPLPLPWQRSYFSDQHGNGWLGQGWSLPLSIRLLRKAAGIVLVDEQGRETELPELEDGEDYLDHYESIRLRRERNGRYRVSTLEGGLHQIFAPLDLDASDPLGERSTYLPLVALEDRNGNQTRISYGDSGYPRLIEDSAGRLLGLQFDDVPVPAERVEQRLTAVALLQGSGNGDGSWPPDAVEPLVFYGYDAGDLTSVRNARGETTRTFRYTNHILVEHAQPGGLVARYEYDRYTTDGKVLRHATNLGQSLRFDYLPDATLVTDQLGREKRYEFNADDELTSLVDASGGRTHIERNNWGQPTAITDPAGNTTRYQYDAYGSPAAIVDALGVRTEFQYHETWRLPISVIDGTGAITQYHYDAAGNLIRHVDALGNATSYNHDARGLVVRVTDAAGGRQTFDYGRYGELLVHTDCLGSITRYEWDARGNLLAQIAADGSRTEYAYDARGLLLRTSYPDGSSESYAHDPLGRLVRHVDMAGNATEWELAGDGKPVARVDALGHRLSYQYDAARRPVVLTDGNGAHYRLAYDVRDNVVGEQGFDGRVTLYDYDAADQLVEKREVGTRPGPAVDLAADNVPELVRTQYRRNAAGRVEEKIIARARDKRTVRSRYEHDAVGRLVAASNPGGRVAFSYDANGRMIEQAMLSLGHARAIQHAYDVLGNRVATTLPDGRTVTASYYGPGYLHQLGLDGDVVCDIERDVMQRETVRRQGALTSYFDYDVMGRRVGQRVRKDAVQAPERVARYYVYERSGNLHALSDLHFGQVSYQYDALDRVTKANAERFAFDPAHNLVDSPGTLVRGNRVSTYEDKRFVYDTHGNVIEKRIGAHTVMRFAYDLEHRIESADVRRNGLTQTTTYGYDVFGRRTFKRDAFGTTEFVWDGNTLLQEIRQRRCLTYLYEPGEFTPIAQIESAVELPDAAEPTASVVRYFHTDQIGAPRELSETDGNISWRANYRAWGNTLVVEYPEPSIAVRADMDPVHQPLRFQGQYYDAETGLHYNRFRYYDPDIGRFVSQDPIGLAGGLNIYQYAPNPQGWTDVLGLAKLFQLGTYGSLNNPALHKGDGLQAHELIRHEYLVQKGLAKCRKSGNPSIALDLDHHTRGPLTDTRGIGGAHHHEALIRQNMYGFGPNDFHPNTKREMDITQGALRKAGVPASRVKALRKQSEKFLRELRRGCP